jgi:hypothetical protein
MFVFVTNISNHQCFGVSGIERKGRNNKALLRNQNGLSFGVHSGVKPFPAQAGGCTLILGITF